MAYVKRYTNKWPVYVDSEMPEIRKIADHFADFHCEMEKYGESLCDVQVIYYQQEIEEQWARRWGPDILAIWTSARVYFPTGECCFFVGSVPIPEFMQLRGEQ